MATTLADIRAKYPDAYKDVPDQQLADAIYAKHYSTVDRREFDARIGLKPYQNTAEATGAALANSPTRVQMGVTGLQQMTAEGQSDNFTALQSAPPEDLAVDANFQNYAAENGLADLTAAAADPVVRDAFFQSAGMDAAKRAVGAALTYQQQTESLKPIDVSAGSLDYYISGAIGSTAEMLPALVASIITKNPTPGVAMIMGQSAGQNYGQGRMEGLDPGRAREYAGLMSAAEAIPSFLPLGQFLSAGAGNLAIDLGKGALAEAFQEGLTQALQIGIQQGYLSPDMTMGEALTQIKDAAIMGAIAGTMMDAGVRGSEKAGSELYKGIYAANEAGKAFIQTAFPKTQQVAPPPKEGPTMLDRVNQALQRKGFAPVAPVPTATEIAITGEQPGTPAAPATPATGEAAAPPAVGAAPNAAPAAQTDAGTVTATPAGAAPSAVDQIITIESGGDPTAQNPNSSAGGLGQFIDSTWIATVRKHAPELAGESDAQILARKKDASEGGIALQRRMLEGFTNDNAAGLQANGIETTPGNLYLAHFLGMGGAQKALSADPGASVLSVMGADVVDANPFLANMTIADMQNWAAKKMGGAGASIIVAGAYPAPTPGTDPEVSRGMKLDIAAPTLDTAADSQEFNTAPAEVQRAGGLSAEAQAEADLIETSQQQRAVVDAGQGVLAPPATMEPASMVTPEAPMVTAPATTGATPAPITTAADLANVAKDVNPDPTPAQIEAGNYRKAHVELNGFNISIENPRGSVRKGVDPSGKAWEVTMPADYGYIKRTTGADGEQVDVYIGQHPESQAIFVVDQIDPDTGQYDEAKVIMGAATQAEAELIYKSAFSDKRGAERMGNITQMTGDEFKGWLANGNPSNPVKPRTPPKNARLTAAEGTLVVRSKDYKKVFGSTNDTNNEFYAHPESPVAQDRAQGWADGKAGLPPQQKPAKNGPVILMTGYNPINPYLEGYIGGRYGDAFVVRAFDAPGTYRALMNGTFDKDPTPEAPKPEPKPKAAPNGGNVVLEPMEDDGPSNNYEAMGNLIVRAGRGESPGHTARVTVVSRGQADAHDAREFLVAFDQHGRLVANGKGSASQVGFSPWMERIKGRWNARIAAHHNHPSGSSFSAGDMNGMLMPGIEVLWAHANRGEISYRGAIPEQVKRRIFEKYADMAPGAAYSALVQKHNKFRALAIDWLSNNTDADSDRGQIIARLVADAWSRAGVLDYRTNYVLPAHVEKMRGYSNLMKEAEHEFRTFAFGVDAVATDRPTGGVGHPGDVGTAPWQSDEAAKDGPAAKPDDPARAKPDRGKAAKAKAEPQGEVITVTTPTGGKVQVRPEVTTIEALQKATGDLQPRDRSRAASDAQIEDMAINLDPDRLLPSADADRGAPIVGPDGIIESGNGRVQALRRASEAYPEKYLAYIKAMKAAGHKFIAVEGTPIVVMRRVTEMTQAERVEFVNAANTSAIARMSATEQAVADAKHMTDDVLNAIEPGRGLNAMSLGAWDNKFAKAFLAKLPMAERAALADKDGQLNTDGVRRIQNALLAAAYGDAATVAKAADNIDDNAKSITGAMIDVGADWLAMRRSIKSEAIDPSYDMTDALMGALKLLDAARSKAAQQSRPVKALINEAIDQIDVFSGAVDPVTIEMVRAFYSEGFGRAKSRDDITAFLRSITTEVQSAIQPQLLGAAPLPGEIINGARRRSEKQSEQQEQLFASRAPGGSRAASGKANRERGVQGPSAQDQQRAGEAASTGGESARVGELSGGAEQAAVERAESVSQGGERTAADRGQAVAQLDPELDALGVDTPMPGYVPMYVKRGVPDRPANDRIRVGSREFELPPMDRPQRREGIRVQLEGIIGPRLYVGKIKGATMLGFYRKSNSEVRLRNYDDIEVMAHEMAHYLDFHSSQKVKFAASYKGRKDVKDLSYTSVPRNVEKEGFAEFVRLWLTQYDEANRAAPGYVKEFETLLRADPTLDKQMHKLQEHMHKWFLQGPHAQLRAKSGEEYTPTEQWMQFVQSYPLERARQNIIDNIHAAKVVERVTTGDVQDATKSAYKQFQMANGAESTYSAIVEFGTPALDGNGSLQFGGDSLMKVFWPVAKHGWKRFDLLMDYFKARRAKELLGQGRERLFTAQEIKVGLALGAAHPEFAAVFGAYQKFNQRMLDWYVDMGLITEAQRDAFGEANKSYVPFHRITKMIAEGGASAGSGIGQRLAGGTANTRDIAVNIVEGLASNVRGALVARAKATMYKQIMASQDGAMFAAKIGPDSKKVTAMLGEQARKVAQVMSDLGIGISSNGFIVNEPAVDNAIYDVNEIAEVLQARPELLDFWLVNQPPKTDGDTYVDSAIIDGEKVYFEVREPLLVEMLTGMGGLQMGAVLRAFMSVKNLQTRAITSMPQFMVPNLVRDTLSAMSLSKNNFVPVVSSLSGMRDTLTKSKVFQEFMLNGGGYGNSIEARTVETRTRRQLDLPAQTNWDRAAKVLAGWDRINSSFEYGTRVGDYALSRKAGRSPMEAAWQAREISTDFSKIGRSEIWAKFLRTVPFANAGIQGLDKTARELTEMEGKMTVGNLAKMNENKAKFLLRGSILTVATLALWLLNNDDDRYKALTDDERARFWWIYLPGTTAPLKIPRPYDIGYIFASIPETMMNYAKDRDGKAAASQLAWVAVNSSPIGEWPGLLQPIMEAQANKDWRGAAIVPEYMASREPRYQYNERTPLMYRKLGELLGVSPLVAQHYASGYLRYYEQVATDLTDAAMWNKEAWGEKPFASASSLVSGALYELPWKYATNQFSGRAIPFRTKWTDGYYELKRRAEGAQSAFSALKAEAIHNKAPLDGFLSSDTNTALVSINRMFSRMDSQLSTGTDMVMAITFDPSLTRAEKETRINAWYAQKNEAMAGMFEQVNGMLDGLAKK